MAPSAGSMNAGGNPSSSKSLTSNKNFTIGAIVLAVLIVGAATVYFINRRGSAETNYETTTDTGLKIHDITVGTGESPKPGQTVVVHYIGWLDNGTEFNNSRTMGARNPAEFRLGAGVIEGWNQGLATMKVGGKRKLYVPSNLAYGPRGRPPAIPPNSNLTFEIELMAIK